MLDMLKNLMHICMSRASGFFPCMIRKMNYDIYVRHDIMRVLFCSVVSGDVLHVVPDQVRPRGYVYEPAWWVHVRVHGPCVKEYHISNPT